MNSHCNGGAGLRACARVRKRFRDGSYMEEFAAAEFQGELERAVFSERGRAAELALAGKEARIGMANTYEGPESVSQELRARRP